MIIYKQDGRITNPEALRKFFALLKDGTFFLKAESRNRRSLNQNNYFHGPVLELVLDGLREAGYSEVKDKTDAKTVLKSLFLRKKISNGLEDIEIIKDTSALTKEEFAVFLDEVIAWAATYLNIYIPEPNKQSELWTPKQYQ